MLKRLATLAEEALVPLTANFIFHDIGKLRLKHVLDSVLFLNDSPVRVKLDFALEVDRLLFCARGRLSFCLVLLD